MRIPGDTPSLETHSTDGVNLGNEVCGLVTASHRTGPIPDPARTVTRQRRPITHIARSVRRPLLLEHRSCLRTSIA
jgi:hypothetical protein